MRKRVLLFLLLLSCQFEIKSPFIKALLFPLFCWMLWWGWYFCPGWLMWPCVGWHFEPREFSWSRERVDGSARHRQTWLPPTPLLKIDISPRSLHDPMSLNQSYHHHIMHVKGRVFKAIGKTVSTLGEGTLPPPRCPAPSGSNYCLVPVFKWAISLLSCKPLLCHVQSASTYS